MPAQNNALFTSDSAEHNTPPEIINAIRDVFGGEIDFDPASNETAQAYIRANRYYTTNGLTANWRCRSLWLNPPFTVPSNRINEKTGKPIRTRVIDLWVDRWVDTLAEMQAAQGALLVPARTDTQWFAPLWGLPMCFVSGRLHFSEAANGATFPTVIIYAGGNRARFYERFADFGECGKFTR